MLSAAKRGKGGTGKRDDRAFGWIIHAIDESCAESSRVSLGFLKRYRNMAKQIL